MSAPELCEPLTCGLRGLARFPHSHLPQSSLGAERRERGKGGPVQQQDICTNSRRECMMDFGYRMKGGGVLYDAQIASPMEMDHWPILKLADKQTGLELVNTFCFLRLQTSQAWAMRCLLSGETFGRVIIWVHSGGQVERLDLVFLRRVPWNDDAKVRGLANKSY